MTAIAVLNPTSLLGRELVETIERRRPNLAGGLSLLSLDEGEVGAVTEAAGAAALVARAEPHAIETSDVLFVPGDLDRYREPLARRRPGSTLVYLAPEAEAEDEDAVPVVAGLNLDRAVAGGVLLSPHPATILLAHLLAPLAELGVAETVATVVQPASLFGRPGLDELFEQAGRMVALRGVEGGQIFPRQLAFNLYPAPRPPRRIAAQVAAVLGDDGESDNAPPLAVHTLQGAVFHGVSALVRVRLGSPASPEEVRERLGGSEWIELSEPDEESGDDLLGPVDAAAAEKVLVGPVTADDTAAAGTACWIWAVMDNLTRGGALNALAILERIA